MLDQRASDAMSAAVVHEQNLVFERVDGLEKGRADRRVGELEIVIPEQDGEAVPTGDEPPERAEYGREGGIGGGSPKFAPRQHWLGGPARIGRDRQKINEVTGD